MGKKYNSKLPIMKDVDELFKIYQHDIRSALLEIASALDRMERSGGEWKCRGDFEQILNTCEIICNEKVNRTERIQEFLSDD